MLTAAPVAACAWSGPAAGNGRLVRATSESAGAAPAAGPPWHAPCSSPGEPGRPGPWGLRGPGADAGSRQEGGAMNEREGARLQPGLEVFDRDGHKLGTVARVHEPAGAGAPGVLESPAGGYL